MTPSRWVMQGSRAIGSQTVNKLSVTQHREWNNRPGRTSCCRAAGTTETNTSTVHRTQKAFAVDQETEHTAFWFPFRSFHDDGHAIGRVVRESCVVRPRVDSRRVLAAAPLPPVHPAIAAARCVVIVFVPSA